MVQRGRARQHGHPFLRHPGQHRVDVEDGLGQGRGPPHEGGQKAGLVAEGVEEGVDHEIAVALFQAHDGAPVGEDAQALGVGGGDALGAARGARGEDDVGEIPADHRPRPLVGRAGRHRLASGQVLLPGHGVPGGVAPQHDHTLESAEVRVRVLEHGHVVEAEEPRHGEQDPGPALGQHVARLRALEPGVDGDEGSPGADDAQGRQHPLVDVGRPDGGPVAGLDSSGHGGPHRVPGCPVELVEAQPGLAVDQRLPVTEAGGRGLDQPRDGPPLQVAAAAGQRHGPLMASTPRRWAGRSGR